MIDLRFVKKLVDMIDGSSVDSIEISSDKGMKIRISKNSNQRATVEVAAPMQMPQMTAPAPAPAPASGTEATPAELEARTKAESEVSGSKVADGRHLLQRARAGCEALSHGRRPDIEGTDTLHHRGNEDHE